MRVVLSRVHGATCEVEGEIVSQIENGLLLIVGFGVDDDEETVKKTASKITLYGRVKHSNRPNFTHSCPGDRANEYFELFKKELSAYFPVVSGRFATHMHISALHDGPVTLVIDSDEV